MLLRFLMRVAVFIINSLQAQACAAFQQCAAQGDPAMCLQQMLGALSSLAAGGGGGAPVGGSPCQGGAGAPMPMPPMPMPMPMPMPQPMPISYPGEVIMEPSSCGGSYPCGDKGSKKQKSTKNHDKKEEKHHKNHKEHKEE